MRRQLLSSALVLDIVLYRYEGQQRTERFDLRLDVNEQFSTHQGHSIGSCDGKDGIVSHRYSSGKEAKGEEENSNASKLDERTLDDEGGR